MCQVQVDNRYMFVKFLSELHVNSLPRYSKAELFDELE